MRWSLWKGRGSAARADRRPVERPPVWLLGGTRADAVRLVPLVAALHRQGAVRPVLVSSGQGRQLYRRALAAFDVRPDRDIRLGRAARAGRGARRGGRDVCAGTSAELASRMSTALDRSLRRDRPSVVVVRGATPTALHGALTAFRQRIPVVHLEAGLRSHDPVASFPDEGHRRLICQLAALHLAPTPAAAANLVLEGIPLDRVAVVGSTAVDAVRSVMAGHAGGEVPPGLEAVAEALYAGQRLLLIAVHRPDSRGEPLREVLAAVGQLLDTHPDVAAVVPAATDRAIRADVAAVLSGQDRAVITGPLEHPDLMWVLARSALVLSDSGGLQEEAPEFGVPVLVPRAATERIEGVYAGCAALVGTDREAIVARSRRLLSEVRSSGTERAGEGRRTNPFGDGQAAERAAAAIATLLGLDAPVVPPWVTVTADGPITPLPVPVVPLPTVPVGSVPVGPPTKGSAEPPAVPSGPLAAASAGSRAAGVEDAWVTIRPPA